VLITGGPGTGKELLAKAIHRASPRCDAAFVAIDCGQLDPSTGEAEIAAAIARAGEGTLHLRDVDDMPPALRPALAHLLDDLQARIVATSDRAPDDLADEDRGSRHLLDRLAAISVLAVLQRFDRGEVDIAAVDEWPNALQQFRAQGRIAGDEPGTIVAAKHGPPLVIGLGDGETFLASDVAAILAHTDQIVFLQDGDVADLRPWGATFSDVHGRPLERVVTTIDWSPEAAEKGGYEHFMLKEIHEQPESLSQSIIGRVDRADRINVEELAGLEAVLRTITRVEIVACGTAYYASLIGATAIQQWTGLPARATVGSEFRYGPPPLDERTLVIAVTQSGETADTIAPTRLARERGCPIVAVTNTVGSAITREADAVMFLQAGPEIAVAASKTFVTQVTTLVLLAAAMAKARGSLPDAEELALGAALRALPAAAARAIEAAALTTPDLARRYVNSRGFMFVGRGATYPAALEGALKLKEISYVHAEGYAAGELKHGPISLLDAECPLVAVATRSSVYDKLISNVMEGRARDAKVIAVATEGDDAIERYADDVCWVPDTHETLSPVLAVIPLQLFAYHIAVARGTDVDQPRNLAKSVTVE